jgi:hypothetical protein
MYLNNQESTTARQGLARQSVTGSCVARSEASRGVIWGTTPLKTQGSNLLLIES